MRNNAPFDWTPAREDAAYAVAEGVLTDAQIAKAAGVTRDRITVWKRHPEFQEKVKAHRAEVMEASRIRSIGRREDRIEAYQQRWDWLKQIREERAADPRMVDIPGGKTGLIVIEESEGVTVKDPANPDGPEKVVAVPTEVAVDTAYLKALTDLEKQAAIEAGQWTEKRETTGKDGGSQVVTLIGMTLEEFDKLDPARKVAMLRCGVGG
jgi:hypothetical protein